MVAAYHGGGLCDPCGEGRFILDACLISPVFVEKFTHSAAFSSNCVEAYHMLYLSRSEVKEEKKKGLAYQMLRAGTNQVITLSPGLDYSKY